VTAWFLLRANVRQTHGERERYHIATALPRCLRIWRSRRVLGRNALSVEESFLRRSFRRPSSKWNRDCLPPRLIRPKTTTITCEAGEPASRTGCLQNTINATTRSEATTTTRCHRCNVPSSTRLDCPRSYRLALLARTCSALSFGPSSTFIRSHLAGRRNELGFGKWRTPSPKLPPVALAPTDPPTPRNRAIADRHA